MNEADALQQQAYDLFANEDYQGACDALLKLELLQGQSPQLSNDLGVALFKLGQTNQALARFKQAAELEGESIVTNNLIELVREQKRQLRALKDQKRKSPSRSSPRSADLRSESPSPFTTLGERLFADVMESWCQDSANTLFEEARKVSDSEWLQAMVDGADSGTWNKHLLPRFAPADTQSMFVGSSGRTAMQEGRRFVEYLLQVCREGGLDFKRDDLRIADFGAGWGRYTRFMLKYAHPDNLFALEVQSHMVERSRKEFGRANFIKVDNFPPTPLQDEFFDLIFGYSVFSHLSPVCADAWIAEFARIVKPGGLVVMTTQGRSFIEFCEGKRRSGDLSHPWFKCLTESFVDTEAAYRDYDAGGFLFSGTTPVATYGEALVSKGYIEQQWQRHFELLHFVDDRNVLPQACFVLRRKQASVAAGWQAGSPVAIIKEGMRKTRQRSNTLVLAMSPRVGSTALASALTSTGQFGAVKEYFNPRHQDLPDAPDPFTRWRDVRLQTGEAIPTFKSCWLDYAPLVANGFDRVYLRDASFIYLDRQDQVAQAISIYRAKQTNQWHLQSGEGQQALSEWDVEAIIYEYELLTKEKKSWIDYFARRGISPLCIDYDEIHKDLPGVVKSIGEYCGIEVGKIQTESVRTDTRKFAFDCPDAVMSELRSRLIK